MSKKKVAKFGLTAAAAVTTVVAANPAGAAAASSVEQAVVQASTNAKALTKFYGNTDLTVSAEFTAAFNSAKKSIANAKAQVAAFSGKEKAYYEATLAQATELQTYAARYIDAVNIVAGELAEATTPVYDFVQSGEVITEDVAAQYDTLSAAIKKAERTIGKVRGEAVREAFQEGFLLDAKLTREAIIFEVSQFNLLNQINADIAAGNTANVEADLAKLDRLKERAVGIKEAGRELYPDLEGVYPELPEIEAALRATETATVEAYEATLAPAVKSVSAINGAQFQVTFNKAIDADTVIDSADGTLLSGTVVAATKVSGTGSFSVTSASLAELSEDGKTLTVTLVSGALNDVNFTVTTDDTIKTVNEEEVAEYTSQVISASDKVAPSVTSVTKLSAGVTRVQFSEPLNNEGSWSFKFADGTSAGVSVDNANINKGYVDLTITDVNATAGKEIVATVIGARDYALNLSSPNPLTVSLSKGSLDGVKPTVSSITPKGLNKVEVKFSEEVNNLTEADFTIDGVARTANDATAALAGTEAIITQDTTDKTKYTVEFAAVSAGYHTVGLVDNAVTDLSGEQSDAFSKLLTFSADSTAPTLVKSEVKKGTDGYEYLHLTFDEAVTLNTITALTATQVKDYVTTTGTIDLTGLTAVSTANKEYKVKLADVEFTGSGAAITKGSDYTVTLTGAVDDGVNNLGTTKITFTRGEDTPTVKQTVSGVSAVASKFQVKLKLHSINQLMVHLQLMLLITASMVWL
ncbi:hypothetical protein [Metabacillus endolithicus]|uniref:hypothetical protein n=1 Tax=Metabacillus endolithicus TaxID=1535204 RepID=UPI001FFBA495|nr:hypothetical protein [Metabacillus endolithicus]UPG65547.1 hypothetical protein MVE64_11570 [Metabacillus endolithicus]